MTEFQSTTGVPLIRFLTVKARIGNSVSPFKGESINETKFDSIMADPSIKAISLEIPVSSILRPSSLARSSSMLVELEQGSIATTIRLFLCPHFKITVVVLMAQ